MIVTVLTGGGGDLYYELGLVSGLISRGITIDYIGSDTLKDYNIFRDKNFNFINLRGSQNPDSPMKEKIFRVLKYYFRLFKYTYKSDSKIFHLQWLNKFIYVDRTILNVYYKLLGKKLVFTAHNINDAERDENDTILNKLTLKFLYRIVDHIIVHTNKMKCQLIEEFNVKGDKISVVPYGINNMVFNSNLTRIQARNKIHLKSDEKILLFFGIIKPYKGLEYLILAVDQLLKIFTDLKLIIAGKIDKNSRKYWNDIQRIVKENNINDNIIEKIEFIPDEEIEVYFKSADVLILPYKYIFQSGVLFLALTFGIPIIATDVGELKEFIIEGEIGFICKPKDPGDLAKKIIQFYNSVLFKNLEKTKIKIINYANEKYSWEQIGEMTLAVYNELL